MAWLLYLFGSGLAFYLGSGMILAAVALFARGASGWRASLLAILARLGIFVALLSAVPRSYWFYGLAIVVTAAWLWSERTTRARLVEKRAALRLATLVIWTGGALLELPYQFSPRLPRLGGQPLYVIADSVTAGTGIEKRTWPDLLPPAIEVHNLARMGATTASALRDQCSSLPKDGGLVLLEIGGNDLLGETSSAHFERDLERLLAGIVAPGRTIVMFELPLPPLCNEYGRVQRRLAARYRIHLIPKRIFIGVLAAEGTTLDSVHLSAAGHERMAAAVWSVIGPAYASGIAHEPSG